MARLGAFAGAVHGIISSWFYWRARPDEERWMRWLVSPLTVVFWAAIGFGTARRFIEPSLSALISAVLGAGFGVVISVRFLCLRGTKLERFLCAADRGVIGAVVGAILGTAPHESLAGGLVGLLAGAVAALVLTARGLDRRWGGARVRTRTGLSRWLVNTVCLAGGGALLGAALEIVFDADGVLTGLLFP
jgi:hypothetical protein